MRPETARARRASRIAAPTVVRYADVSTLTRSGTISGKNDKGSGSKTRTN